MRVPRGKTICGTAGAGVAILLAGAAGLVLSAAQPPPVRSAQFAAAVSVVPASLLPTLRATPHGYFRFVNKPWMQAVCDEYRADIGHLPTVRLHGDAHVEQYAVTADSRGLDDFDDSAMGPAVVDIVRFLGSLQLVGEQRGWQDQNESFIEAFFRGYRRALGDRADMPEEPAVVSRLRQRPTRTPLAFLAWAESLMSDASPENMHALQEEIAIFRRNALEQVADLSAGYLAVKKYGLLHLGIGSALSRKVLMRVEGPSSAPEDDVIIEAKELIRLDSASCVSVPPPIEAFRVVTGASQLGRLHHQLLMVVPVDNRPDSPGWWVRSWDPTYRELEIAGLETPRDLLQVAEDAGAQLGAGNTRGSEGEVSEAARRRELVAVGRLEPRIRRTAARLASEIVDGWEALRAASP